MVPTLFDAAKRKGLTSATFFWPETKGDPVIDYNLPETLDANNHADPTGADPPVPGGAPRRRSSDRPLLRVVRLARFCGSRRSGSGAGRGPYHPRPPPEPACDPFSRNR